MGAFLSETNGVMSFIGFGVYEGDFFNDKVGAPNPRIKLDSGETVWGYQCWWGAEKKVKDRMEKVTVIKVDPPKEES